MGDIVIGVDVGLEDRTAMVVGRLVEGRLQIESASVVATHINWLLAELRLRKISPEIIERVRRLNPQLSQGAVARGIHLTGEERWEMFALRGCLQKMDFIRRRGRQAFAQLPDDAIVKRGKRVYVRLRWVSGRL